MEDQNTEWKESWQDDYLKQIASFCNTAGGIMTIGINDRGEVVGVRNPDKLLEKLPVKFRDKLGLIDASFSVVTIDGRDCVRIVVPKATVSGRSGRRVLHPHREHHTQDIRREAQEPDSVGEEPQQDGSTDRSLS